MTNGYVQPRAYKQYAELRIRSCTVKRHAKVFSLPQQNNPQKTNKDTGQGNKHDKQ